MANLPPRPYIPPPDDLTVPQLIFDYEHPTRPLRPSNLPCLIDDETGRGISLEELRTRTTGFAAWLQNVYKLGVDDVVAFSSPNDVDYGTVCWGVHEAGGIVAAMSPSLTPGEIEHQFRIANPKLIVAHPLTIQNVRAALSNLGQTVDADIILIKSYPGSGLRTLDGVIDEATVKGLTARPLRLSAGESKTKMAFLCFSSGTTGKPKAVALSHYNIVVAVVQLATSQGVNDHRLSRDEARFRVGDVSTGVLPFFHIYGLAVNLHLNLYSGLTTVVTAVFNFEKMLANIVRYKINILFIVPPQATLLVKHPAVKNYDISHIHCLALAAAALSPEVSAEILKTWPNIHLGQGYGLTESTGGVAMWPVYPKVGRFGTAGTILPAGKVRVVKADGTDADLKKGETGELLIKGPYVALGYYKDPEATKKTFLEGGWLASGDEVTLTEDNLLVIVDRIKEIIKVKGFQVSPNELEGHLLSHPDVADAGVVGVQDDYAGELPIAFVVLKEAARLRIVGNAQVEKELKAQLMKHVSDAKSKYKWLKDVFIIPTIPRNPSGKILRRVLRDDVKAGRYASAKAKL